MKSFLIVSGIVLAGAFVMIVNCAKKPEPEIVRPLRTIVFFGDSVTYGYGVDTDKESFFSRIRNVLGTGMYGNVAAINAGVSGDDTSEALKRVTTGVTAHNPDIVVIAFGLNDCQNKAITPEIFRANIANMISGMPSRTRVVLATSNSFLDTGQSSWENMNKSLDPLMNEIRAIARERGLPLIDVHEIWENQLRMDQRHTETFYIDPTHPSAKGHGVIYEAYMSVLRRLLMADR